MRPHADPPRDLALLVRGWREGIDDEPLVASVLAHRAQRTLFDWILMADIDTDAKTDPVVRATGRVLSPVQALIGAHLHRDDASPRYQVLLNRAEQELTQALADLRCGRAQQG
ncbi:hypothetical protein [Nocardiopsis synnemataformans]|uniref:hypothetical protein n=1 Tax=Nocardiopsis synnemataformans TaxID=61305 RepID=UPI003EBBBB7C